MKFGAPESGSFWYGSADIVVAGYEPGPDAGIPACEGGQVVGYELETLSGPASSSKSLKVCNEEEMAATRSMGRRLCEEPETPSPQIGWSATSWEECCWGGNLL